jgi:hypothetical protein
MRVTTVYDNEIAPSVSTAGVVAALFVDERDRDRGTALLTWAWAEADEDPGAP